MKSKLVLSFTRQIGVSILCNLVQEYGREAHRQMPGNDPLKAYAQKMWPLLVKDEAAGQTAALVQVPL
jgi:hypothetical protein